MLLKARRSRSQASGGVLRKEDGKPKPGARSLGGVARVPSSSVGPLCPSVFTAHGHRTSLACELDAVQAPLCLVLAEVLGPVPPDPSESRFLAGLPPWVLCRSGRT